MNNKTNSLTVIGPIILSFFVMGMVDIVGVSTNFAKVDFELNDLTASVLPMMVFLWFAVFSIPTSILMNRVGRKRTVLMSFLIGIIALLLPLLYYNLYILIAAFALLGISNTILQVSLNPLVASMVQDNKLASTLTFGQFVKAIASFLGPIITGIAVKQFGDWTLVFAVYAITSLLSLIWLYFTPISAGEEETTKRELTTFANTFAMLKDSLVLKLFLGILLIVGIDVCMNTNTPQLLTQRLGLEPAVAGLGSSLYFGARTIGAFIGAMILIKAKPANFLKVNMAVAIIGFLMLMFITEQWLLLTAIGIIGLTCANVFSIIFSFALQYKPQKSNEMSSLMIMGVAGGAVVTPIVGLVANNFGISLSFGVLLLSVVYILLLSLKFSK